MLATAVALLIWIQPPQQDLNEPTRQSPSQILSKMFARYAAAKTVVGTIKMTQRANNVAIHIETELQFDRPSLIYLHQVRDGSQAHQWYLTSDGKEFSYDVPDSRAQGIYGKRRPVEYVTQHDVKQTISDFLTAAGRSLGDINPMIESAAASKELLKKLTGQWATLTYAGRVTLNGQTVTAITGHYRQDPASPVSGAFEAYVNEDGDFVKYVLRQRLEFPQVSKEAIEVLTTWESNLKVGAPTNASLYKVIL